MSLGGILLCITGRNIVIDLVDVRLFTNAYCNLFLSGARFSSTLGFKFPGSEAMFADLGHFSQLSIKACDCFLLSDYL